VHRLSQALLSTICSTVTSSAGAGVLVLTTEGKYFSNDFDQSQVPLHVQADMGEEFRALVTDLLALPMPTVATVTGHAAAVGCALVLAHDAAIMRASCGFLYMSEVGAGIKIIDHFATRRWDGEVVWSWQRYGRPRGPRCGIRSRIMALMPRQ
jgi:Delta3-Delta2-enoyl-CoA isomerase